MSDVVELETMVERFRKLYDEMSDQGWKLPINHEYGRNLICPECNYTLVLKQGKTGPFYGCPHCDYTCASNKKARDVYYANRQKGDQVAE